LSKDLKIVDHLFRHQFGKMVAILVRLFGFNAIEKAEDIVQESFLKALSSWKINGLPDNPEAWLIRTAKNLAIDQLRRKKLHSKFIAHQTTSGVSNISIENLFLEKEIEDAQLRMIFACCHPSLAPSDQIALTLQVVSGFSIQEIANALLLKKEQVKKRIQRAKAKLKTSNLDLEIPSGKELSTRLPMVEKIIYLIFNEGYYSYSNSQIIREELCFEAMRLARIIVVHPLLKHPDIYALLGLMCFHASRLSTRISPSSEVVLFEDQDRKLWNKELIFLANQYMYNAVETDEFSTYHYQSAIAAEYVKPEKFKDTNWMKILHWYDALIAIDSSPIFRLSRIVVYIYLNRRKDAEKELSKIDNIFPSQKQFMIDSIWASLYEKNGDHQKSKERLKTALENAPSELEKKILRKRLAKIVD